ncbi:MAG TPA: LacI family DNA-binding transcriptional regulator [Solirubrobacterales bacterium]|nr:LacI family DNA-binding transcriptional regulator [Solirubrobacterales bacterium]
MAGSPKRPRGSLAEVAELAGVSIATASRVVNDSPHPVAEATRARVLAAAEELGYSPSALARALVTRRSRIIGVIVGDIVDPYFAEITRGIEDVCSKAGYMTIVCNADRSTEVEIEQLKLLTDYHAEGVVFAGSGYIEDDRGDELAALVERASDQEIKVLSLARRDFEAPSVRIDNRAVARELTEYLISLGHRRIAFIKGPEGLYASADRLGGYEDAMGAAGLEAGPVHEGDFTYDMGHAAAVRLLADAELPDAVIGANDETAIGALAALRQAEIAVPDRVSVAGMTDTRLARFSDITTVSIPLYQFGAIAARRIIAGAGDADVGGDTLLPHRLVPRSTTARR